MALFCEGVSHAEGIPEPSLIWYGSVSSGSQPITPISVVWQITNATASLSVSATMVQVNGQTFYIARVPLETRQVGSTVFSPNTNALGLALQAVAYDRRVAVNATNASPASSTAAYPTFSLSGTDRGKIERIDLVTSASTNPFIVWLTQHGLPPSTDPNSYPPNKPLTYYQEFLAGTDPTDPKSLFKFVDIRANQNGLTVYWAAFSGRTYALDRSMDLAKGTNGFTTLQTNIQATPPTNSFHDITATGSGPYFYRVYLK